MIQILPDIITPQYKSFNCSLKNGVIEIKNLNNFFWIVFPLNSFWKSINLDSTNSKFNLIGKFNDKISCSFLNQAGEEIFEFNLNNGLMSISKDINPLKSIQSIKFSGNRVTKFLILALKFLPEEQINFQQKDKSFHFIHSQYNLKYWRRNEKEVALNLFNVNKEYKKDDIVWVRIFEEELDSFNKNEIYKKTKIIEEQYPNVKIINDVRHIENSMNKIKTFEIWKQNEIKCPSFEKLIGNKNEIAKKFVKYNGQSLLRTDRIYNSKGITFVSERNINILNRDLSKFNFIVKKYQTRNDFQKICKSYVVHDQIICSYCKNYQRRDYGIENQPHDNFNDFVQSNKLLLELESKYKKEILNAVSSLGLQIGNVDYIITDNNQLLFLEVNSHWGSGNSFLPWPENAKLIEELNDKKDELQNQIPNVYKRMNEELIWKEIYNKL